MPTIVLSTGASADDGYWREGDSTFNNNFSNFSTGNGGSGFGPINGFIRFVDSSNHHTQ